VAEEKSIRQLLIDRIAELASDRKEAVSYSNTILTLAEAYAWLTVPAQPHGGSSKTTVQ
jgi:ribosomal protein L20